MRVPKFNERAVLVVAVIGLFGFQLGLTGYQVLTCDEKGPGREYCQKRNEYLSKVSDSAANVFLALLVPASIASGSLRNKKEEKDLN